MQRDKWEKLKALFESASRRSGEEREAYLRELQNDDPEVLGVLTDMLRNHSESGTTRPAPETPAVFSAGDLVADRFRVVRFIDRGGMGEVYECVDQRLNLRVALKTLRAELGRDAAALERFRRELRVARDVAHPNVCRVFEYVEHAGKDGGSIPAITMEFIDGQSLSEMIRRDRPIELGMALSIVRQLSAGLGALHQSGIIHRDLKPSNVMIERGDGAEPRAILMDFGLAKGSRGTGELFETSINVIAGAPYFLSPEQLRGDRPTKASDIYALGLLIDEMVTASRAFPGESVQAIYYSKLFGQVAPPSERAQGLPGNWSRTILICLDPEPNQRFAAAEDVVASLEGRREQPTKRDKRRKLSGMKVAMGSALAIAVLAGATIGALSMAPPIEIAVNDIENQTGNSEYNYLGQGLSTQLVRQLTASSGIRVFATHKTKEPAKGGLRRFLFQGRIQSKDGAIVLIASLNDRGKGGDKPPVWKGTFGAERFASPIELEAELYQGVLSSMENSSGRADWVRGIRASTTYLALTRPVWRILGRGSIEIERESVTATVSNTALEDYMRGRQLVEISAPEQIRAGSALLQRAVAADPGFALGYSALANSRVAMLNWSEFRNTNRLDEANHFAGMAVALDPYLPEAFESRAQVEIQQWKWREAREDFEHALRLRPTFALARRHYAILLTQTGHVEDGLVEARQAAADDPYDTSGVFGYGLILYISGRYEEAIALLEPLAKQNSLAASHNLGEAYSVAARQATGEAREVYFAKALAEAQRVRDIEAKTKAGLAGKFVESDRMFALFHAMKGDLQAAAPYIEHLKRYLEADEVSPAVMAWIFASEGKKTEALDLLETAVKQHDRHLLFTKVYPFLDGLRGERRFQNVLAAMNL